MLLNPFTLHTPESLREAVDLWYRLDRPRLLAGGTFLLNSLKVMKKKRMRTPEHVISLRRVGELKGISREKDEIVIGAMTRIADLLDAEVLTGNAAILRRVCREISTTPIRNMATIGGNLTCRYTWTEMGGLLIALGGRLDFIGPEGEEDLPVEEFFAGGARTDKILTRIRVPLHPKLRTAYRRVKKTSHVDVPLLTVCISRSQEGKTRAVINNGSAFPQRDRAVEAFLDESGRRPGIGEEAWSRRTVSIYETRGDAYKQYMLRVSLRDAIEEVVRLEKGREP